MPRIFCSRRRISCNISASVARKAGGTSLSGSASAVPIRSLATFPPRGIAQPMQGLDLLSIDGLDRDFANLGTSRGFEQRRGIRSVGFIAPHIGFDVMRRQQTHRVPKLADPPRPVVCAPAGLHHALTGLQLHKEPKKLGASQPAALRDAPISICSGNFEDTFCQINRNDRSIHIGLLLERLSLIHTCSAWHIDAVLPFQEESISTVRAIA